MVKFIVAILIMCISFSGCETLKKKFTRKKKQSQAEDNSFIPVLEPQEYPAPEFNPGLMYKQHYALIKVWYKDLWTGLDDKDSDKRVRYNLKQIYSHIDAMHRLVDQEKQEALDRLKGILKYYDESLNGPAPLRNISRVQSDLRAFHRHLNSQLSYGKAKAHLVPVAKDKKP